MPENNNLFYEEKLPFRWAVGEKIKFADASGYTRSQDIDYDRKRNRAGSPPNTAVAIYTVDENSIIIAVEKTTLVNVPLTAHLLRS